MIEGKITAIRNVVVDVEFPEEKTPQIYDSLVVRKKDGGNLILEVQNILDPGFVRTVAMGDVFGLSRGLKVVNTGKSIEVPVGEQTQGRILNVLGEPIDELGVVKTKRQTSIHNRPPTLAEQEVEKKIFETG